MKTINNLDSLAFIDQTLYANEGNSSRVKWTNAEVLEMLRDVRGLLVQDLEPPLFKPTPVRIQLSRKRGWRKPAGTIVVSRPGRWGNPFVVGTPENGGNITRQVAVESYERALREGRLSRKMADVAELTGHDLACWCPLDEPCHADVLLRLANSSSTTD